MEEASLARDGSAKFLHLKIWDRQCGLPLLFL
jgi:hypothetical protein